MTAPTRGTVCIETYGCAFNQSDTEAMAGVLEREGYRVVEEASGADLVIINTCTVKDRTYARFQHRFDRMKRAARAGEGPAVLVAGCIPKAAPDKSQFEGVTAIGPGQLDQIADAAQQAITGHPQHFFTRRERETRLDRATLPTRRTRPHVEIIPLAAGCLSSCTFCQTRLARGRLESYRPSDLIERVQIAADAGVHEVWLTAQDAGAYGRDTGVGMTALLRRLCAIPGDFRIRFGMTSPCWLIEELDAYLDAFTNPKLFTFWHVPLQSGSDAVLSHMRRGNTARDFLHLAERFHAAFPAGALLTDLIIGYPTETDADFEATLAVMRDANLAGINRSNFSPRPGTSAAKLKPLPIPTQKNRMARCTADAATLCHAWHMQWIGRRETVRVFERDGAIAIAHNQAGRPVHIESPATIGNWLHITYSGAGAYHHLGTIAP